MVISFTLNLLAKRRNDAVLSSLILVSRDFRIVSSRFKPFISLLSFLLTPFPFSLATLMFRTVLIVTPTMFEIIFGSTYAS
uniref:Uncharacterized protein n=1 Tax=Lepeophtheirus salmonis TaxID=72036 RepID=A0A0K2UG60_LEPSM